jgi:hypothetical protein
MRIKLGRWTFDNRRQEGLASQIDGGNAKEKSKKVGEETENCCHRHEL